MMRQKITYLSLILLISFLPTHIRSSSGWLRFCATGESFRASATECSGGYWLKKTTAPQCLCAHGVWVLSKGYCDPNFAIVVGMEGTCFALSVDVRWIRMIGVPDDAFSPYYFVTGKYFDRIDASSFASPSRQILAKEIYAGSINPRSALEHVDRTSCVRPRKIKITNTSIGRNEITDDEISDGLPDVFNVAQLEGEEKPWSFQQVDVCGPNSNEYSYIYGASPHHFLQNMESIDGNSIPHTCNDTCLEQNEWDQLLFNAKVGTNLMDEYPTFEESEVTPVDSLCIEWNPKWDGIPNKTKKEIAEQTKRISTTQINYAFFKQKTPEVNLAEYKLFQKSRRVMEKVCPNTEVPPLFLRGVMRMFRHALNESLDTYPYLTHGDEAENNRIMDALTKCYEEPVVQGMTFTYNTSACPNKFLSVNYTFKDNVKKSLNSYVNCENIFNTSLHDFVVETAWKIVLFSQYFCARHFETISIDHSRYVDKMSRFFNREIQYRWFHPGKSFDAMNYIFRTFNLKKIAFGLDRCVGAARTLSQMKHWIGRPKFVEYCGMEGTTPSSSKKRNVDKDLTSVRIRKLKKTTWNGTAFCLQDYKDPLSIVTGYKQEALRSCQKEDIANILS